MNLFRKQVKPEFRVYEESFGFNISPCYSIMLQTEFQSGAMVTSYKLAKYKDEVRDLVGLYGHLVSRGDLAEIIFKYIETKERYSKNIDMEADYKRLQNKLLCGDFE